MRKLGLLFVVAVAVICASCGLFDRRIKGTAVQVERDAITYQEADGSIRQVHWWGYTGPADVGALLKQGDPFELVVGGCTWPTDTCDFGLLRVAPRAR